MCISIYLNVYLNAVGVNVLILIDAEVDISV